MTNLLDYLDWRGDLSLRASSFNEVDALILSELSFINFGGIVPRAEQGDGIALREAARAYFDRNVGREIDMGVLVPDRIPDMLCRMAASKRFGGMLLNGFEELIDTGREQQFAAVSIVLGDGTVFLSFRGTDDTIVGWKEDLNLGFLDTIPSQEQAARYLNRMARQYEALRLRLGGHSKGGNLAIYAAVHTPAATQDRIVHVYNNDGPGFVKSLNDEAAHQRIAARILTFVPQSSVVGRLLEHEASYQVVFSSAEGMMQHDGFTWEVRGAQFHHLDDFSREGKVIEETIAAWEATLSPKQREDFAAALYAMLRGTGAKTLSEMNGDKLKSAVGLLKTYQGLDRETRSALSGSLRLLMKLGARSVAQDVQENELEPLRRRLDSYLEAYLGYRGQKK